MPRTHINLWRGLGTFLLAWFVLGVFGILLEPEIGTTKAAALPFVLAVAAGIRESLRQPCNESTDD